MPKKAYLAPHMNSEELKEKYRTTVDPVESRRWHILWKISLGWTVKASSVIVGLDYNYAQTILKKYNEQGKEGVKNQKKISKPHRRGKAPLLTPEQLKKLGEKLKERPDDGGIWSGPKVARWIAQETKREKVANQRGWEYLKKLKYSCQKPRPKHHKENLEKQEEFKENLPLRVKEVQEKHPLADFSDQRSVVEVWFFDEHRVGLKPIIRKVWAPIGSATDSYCTTSLCAEGARRVWLYVYGFVKPKTGETHWYLIPRVNTKWLNRVFKAFAEDVGAKEEKIIVLVEDNAGWHRSQKVELPLGIIEEFLPPYSPELQPAERLWSLVDESLVNEHFKTIEEMEEVLAIRCRVLQEDMRELS